MTRIDGVAPSDKALPADALMQLADDAIHAYAAWLAEFTTGDLQSLNVERLNTEKDAARERLRVALALGVVASADGWIEAGLVCQACAGDAPGGKCSNPKCVGGPIVRELVPGGVQEVPRG